MPAGYVYVIISAIAAIPAKNNIAKAIAIAHAINKFFMVDHFSAQNAIGIGKRKFYFLDVIFLYVGYYLVFIHEDCNISGDKLSILYFALSIICKILRPYNGLYAARGIFVLI